MGQYFYYVNLFNREMFNGDAFDQNIKEGAVGFGLQGVALALCSAMGVPPVHPLVGSWVGDSIAVVGSDGEVYEEYEEFEGLHKTSTKKF